MQDATKIEIEIGDATMVVGLIANPHALPVLAACLVRCEPAQVDLRPLTELNDAQLLVVDGRLGGSGTCAALEHARMAGCVAPALLASDASEPGDDDRAMRAGFVDCVDRRDLGGPLFRRSLRYMLSRQATEAALRNREAALADALAAATEANAARGEFLARMSHELRTPLNAIIGFADLLSGVVPLPVDHARDESYARMIRSSAGHLLEIVNDVLDLARIDGGHLEVNASPIALAEITREVAGQLFPEVDRRGQSISLRLDGAVEAFADPRLVHQILLNLIGNAAKYGSDDGSITVRGSVRTETVELAVLDNGPGIDPRLLKNVFEPFVRDGNPHHASCGTGLGLPISRMLAERMGGTLTLKSVPGEGTEAILRLPAGMQMRRAA